jgi:hypothetical protein
MKERSPNQELPLQYHAYTECRGQVVRTTALYSGGPVFISKHKDQLS